MSAKLFASSILRTTVKHRPAPSLFFLPGIGSKPWYDRSEFAWVSDLEDNCAIIKDEFQRVRNLPSDYEMNEGEHSLHQGDWKWHSFIKKGQVQPRFAETCPQTAAILSNIPDISMGCPFDYAFFSVLQPGARIKAHTGPTNMRIRCHLALDVPPPEQGACLLRVADEARPWKQGQCLIFDDSYEHEVVHEGKEERVVLLFDTWHPAIELAERAAIQEMFEAARRAGWLKE